MTKTPKAEIDPGSAAERGVCLAVFERGLTEQVRVVWDHYEGHQYLSIRRWYCPDLSGNWRPTKRGVTVRPAELPELAAAVVRATALAHESDTQS